MKKILLFTLIFTLILSFVSCSDENVLDSTSDSTSISTSLKEEETTGTANDTKTETTATETTETTSFEDRYNLGMEYVMNYEAFIITDSNEYKPYTSTIYYQNPYMTGDGILMFVSMENQLPHWIEEDVIPYIAIDADSDVHFEYHENTELKHTGRFRVYVQDENGRVSQVAELLNSSLKEVYAYGQENLSDRTVYISYPFMLQYGDYSHLTDGIWGDHAVHDIMCIFKTSF